MRVLRDAVRQWARTPITTFIVVLSLALGIGANTAIFSLIDSLLIRSLPVHEPDRLVRIGAARVPYHGIPTWRQIDASRLFEATAAMSLLRPDISDSHERHSAFGLAVSGTFFDALGIRPAIGRLLTVDDDRIGTPLMAVVDYEFWQSRYRGRPDVLGSIIHLDGKPFTIVGVTERGFFGLNVARRFDVATSLNGYDALYPGQLERPNNSFSVVARLRPGQSRIDAENAVRQLQAKLVPAARLPERLRGEWNVTPAAAGLNTSAQDRYRKPLVILMALAALILVMASMNVANLLLARSVERRGELAVRLSLGASRWSLVRSVMLECVIITLAGAVAAVVIGIWTARAIVSALAVNESGVLTTWIEVPLNLRLLAFTVCASAVTAMLFGVGPAWRSMGVSPLDAMRHRARGTLHGAGQVGVPQLLLGLQVALAFMLVLGGGLLVRSFVAMTTQDLGFDPHDILVAVPDFSRSTVAQSQRAETAERIRQRVLSIPGVQDAAIVDATPFGLGNGTAPIAVDGRMPDDSSRVVYTTVGDGYFRTLDIAIKTGREFAPFGKESRQSAIINEAFASRYFGGHMALGQMIRIGLDGKRQVEVVGVAGNVRDTSLRDGVDPALYVPFYSDDGGWIEINVRTSAPSQARAALLAIIPDAAPGASVEFRSIDTGINYSAARDRVIAILAGAFGFLALLLATVGLYGVIRQQALRRIPEFGLRVAIGAAPASITALVLRQAGIVIAGGLLLGLAAASAFGRVIGTLLYEVTPRDPVSMVSAALLLSSVTLIAAFIPARRAARVDPMTALREQ